MLYRITDINTHYIPLWGGSNRSQFATQVEAGKILFTLDTNDIDWAHINILASGRDHENLDIQLFDYESLQVYISIKSSAAISLELELRGPGKTIAKKPLALSGHDQWQHFNVPVNSLYGNADIASLFLHLPSDCHAELLITDLYFCCEKRLNNSELLEQKHQGKLVLHAREINSCRQLIDDEFIQLKENELSKTDITDVRKFITNRYDNNHSSISLAEFDEIINLLRYRPQESEIFYTFKRFYETVKAHEQIIYKRVSSDDVLLVSPTAKFDLSGLSVIIALRIDTPDRLINLKHIVRFYETYYKNFELLIIEHGERSHKAHFDFLQPAHIRYHQLQSQGCFHKSRVLNYGIALAKTRYVILHDADVFFRPEAIPYALRLMQRKNIAFMFPYNNVMVQIKKKVFKPFLDFEGFFNTPLPFYDDHFLMNEVATHEQPDWYYPLYGDRNYPCTGGAVIADKEKLLHCGGYNENIISYSYEDVELSVRLRILGYDIYRLSDFNCYHLEHERGSDSLYNAFHLNNKTECKRVMQMSQNELQTYVDNRFRKIEITHNKNISLTNEKNSYNFTLTPNQCWDMSAYVLVFYVHNADYQHYLRILQYIKLLNQQCKHHSIIVIESLSRELFYLYCNANVQYEYRENILTTREILAICLSKTNKPVISIWANANPEAVKAELKCVINYHGSVFDKAFTSTIHLASFYNSASVNKYLQYKDSQQSELSCSLILLITPETIHSSLESLTQITTWKKAHHELILILHQVGDPPSTTLQQNPVIDSLITTDASSTAAQALLMGLSQARNDILLCITADLLIQEALTSHCCRLLSKHHSVGMIRRFDPACAYIDGIYANDDSTIAIADHPWKPSFNGTFFSLTKQVWEKWVANQDKQTHQNDLSELQFFLLDQQYDILNLDYDARLPGNELIREILNPVQLVNNHRTNHAIYAVVNREYLTHCLTFLNSIKTNWPHHPDLLLHYSELDATEISLLSAYEGVILIEENEHGLPAESLSECLHPLVFNRLNLWSDRYQVYENILHLDIDILVLQPLDSLLEKDEFFIVENKGEMFYDCCSLFNNKLVYENDFEVLDMLQEDGLDFPVEMVNAGIFMIPRKYRNQSSYTEITKLLARYKRKVAFADQSIISLWCAKQNIPISRDIQFNYQAHFFRLPNIIPPEEAAVIHFTSPDKPGTKGFESNWILDGKRDFYRTLYNSYKNAVHDQCK